MYKSHSGSYICRAASPHPASLNPLFLPVVRAFLLDDKNRQAQMSITLNLFLGTDVLSSSYTAALPSPNAPSASRGRLSPFWPSNGARTP